MKTHDDYVDRLTRVSPSDSRLKGMIVAILSGILMLFICYLFIPRNHSLFIDGLAYGISIVLTAIMFFGGLYTIPTGKIGIEFWLGEPKVGKILAEGIHWQLPFGGKVSSTNLFASENALKTDDYTFENIACYNKAFIKIDSKIQWRLLNPFKHLHQTSKDMAAAYRNTIHNSIADYINENNITNSDVFSYKSKIEKAVLVDLEKAVQKFGETIDNVSITITQADQEWVKIWRDQDEISILVDKASSLAKLNGISADEALRQIALKDGWIKGNESIYKIRDIDKIISLVSKKL